MEMDHKSDVRQFLKGILFCKYRKRENPKNKLKKRLAKSTIWDYTV